MQLSMAAKMVCSVLYDSHCHLHEAAVDDGDRRAVALSSSASKTTQADVTHLVLCGTHPQIDWDLVEHVVTRSANVAVVSGFGVHPWFVPAEKTPTAPAVEHGGCRSESGDGGGDSSTASPAGLSMSLAEIVADLQRRLSLFPRAIVAEIGLDKLRGPPQAVQKDAFLAQLRVAAAHGRPVSVHCVGQYGLLMEVLQSLSAEDTPPAIIVHAFTGSTEVAKSLLNMKDKKRRPQKAASAAVESAEERGENAAEAIASSLLTQEKEHWPSHTPVVPQQQQQPKKTKRGGGASADKVRIKERIFFGVGLSTSFTVKNFATQTLPLLLSAQRMLLETDAHYCAERGWGSSGGAAECVAETCVYVDEQEHVEQLRAVMRAVEAAALQSPAVVKAAQEAGVAPGAMVREAVAAASTRAFAAVLT